jgi:ABC-type glutathione transport system ATPase component
MLEGSSMLDIKGVTKRFGSLVAVDHVTFSARAGETIGLLGPNGAGKTTTVSIIAGLADRVPPRHRSGLRRSGRRAIPLGHGVGSVWSQVPWCWPKSPEAPGS